MIFRLSIAGASAWKLGLIPVLATVLFKVTRPSAPEVEVPASPVVAETQVVPSATATRPPAAFPDLSLSDALQFDPFGSLPMPKREVIELPPEVVEVPVIESKVDAGAPAAPVVNPLVEKAATLKQLKVSAVFRSEKGSAAIIDSKMVRVGDLLSPGVRVVEIRGTDVILRVENGEAGPRAEQRSESFR